ncbi:MAG: hypothetical protein IKU47_00925 [Oscillospiraceae bacterium]|nr:hypothetical protein [Oscillospiraceae bacterium]
MKKLAVALSTIFCAVLIVISVYTFLPENNNHQAENEISAGYTIIDFGGKVAVFEDGMQEPVAVYDIYTHLLPENDIELLRRGIHVDTLSELQSRLEDLGL